MINIEKCFRFMNGSAGRFCYVTTTSYEAFRSRKIEATFALSSLLQNNHNRSSQVFLLASTCNLREAVRKEYLKPWNGSFSYEVCVLFLPKYCATSTIWTFSWSSHLYILASTASSVTWSHQITPRENNRQRTLQCQHVVSVFVDIFITLKPVESNSTFL